MTQYINRTPNGTWPAAIKAVMNLGQPNSGGPRKLALQWVCRIAAEGLSLVTWTYNLPSSETEYPPQESPILQVTSALLGRPLHAEERPDLKLLLERSCMIGVYNFKVTSHSPLPAGTAPVKVCDQITWQPGDEIDVVLELDPSRYVLDMARRVGRS